jgi:hydrogenase maturation protein HypF
MSNTRSRIRAEVEGIVQGVGFRPFVFQLAQKNHLAGYVMNTSYGALIEVEGPDDDIEAFIAALRNDVPPLAEITHLATKSLPAAGDTDFTIRHSEAQSERSALISPDVAVCEDCLAEMFDSDDRRYRYPFINCTNCGPRYTIITDVPYDRDKTSMHVFEMCEDCSREYHDPANRRFHAQPNACPVCGPKVWLATGEGETVEADDPIGQAMDLLKQGRILAVKGLGGFHLAVDATNDDAVRRLRQRKHREEKPLAVMSPDLEAIRQYAHVDEPAAKVLQSIQRPIVLLNARQPSPLAPSVAPDNKYIGAMLPYTPLHHLLLHGFLALVMTSGNLSEEPIAIDNDEALARLGNIADAFLLHDRDIYLRTDDSVVRPEINGASQLRRSRGFAPAPVFLKFNLPQVLAVGGELKNTICLTKQNRAFLSQHVGDLENLIALEFFEKTIDHLKRILDISPVVLAYDLHPEYLSTKWALDQPDMEKVGVQHHHAHAVSAMAEHGLDGPVIALSCDGTGYGEDGQIWGGEILVAYFDRYERRGHIDYTVLPGGAAAIREPWRMAVSYLESAYGSEFDNLDLDLLKHQDSQRLSLLRQVITKQTGSPLTSSLGRLFDGAAALIGLKDKAAFEGQAAMMLEMICPEGDFKPYDFDLDESDGRFLIKPQAIIRGVVGDVIKGADPARISGRFHAAVTKALADVTARIHRDTGINDVVLSGGCFQNQILTQHLTRVLIEQGRSVFSQGKVPANDGGLSLGQAVAAGNRYS